MPTFQRNCSAIARPAAVSSISFEGRGSTTPCRLHPPKLNVDISALHPSSPRFAILSSCRGTLDRINGRTLVSGGIANARTRKWALFVVFLGSFH